MRHLGSVRVCGSGKINGNRPGAFHSGWHEAPVGRFHFKLVARAPRTPPMSGPFL